MTEAEQAIADLDAALATDGEWVELWRETGTQKIPFKVRCRASVRTLDAKELVGGLTQDSSRVVISPTEIVRAGWPGPNSSATPTNQDRRVPKRGDKAKIAGKLRNIEVVRAKYEDDRLVRIEMDVLG